MCKKLVFHASLLSVVLNSMAGTALAAMSPSVHWKYLWLGVQQGVNDIEVVVFTEMVEPADVDSRS